MATQPEAVITDETAGLDYQDTEDDVQTIGLEQSQAIDYNENGNQAVQFADVGEVPGVTVGVDQFADVGEVPGVTVGVAQIQGGLGADDDSGSDTAAPLGEESDQTEADTNAATQQQADSKITPRPNILDQYASYTYQASVYMLTPAQMVAYQNQQKKNISGYNLLFQSGGAPPNTSGPQGARAGQANSGIIDGRNPFFPKDYYIETITINNSLFGKSTMAAHSAAELKFTVIEPANISLIDNIYLAAQDLQPKDAAGRINYQAIEYLMVIRFYGYDRDGRIQRVGGTTATGVTDSNALVEKYIPFKIKAINWSVSSRLVTYEFDCAPINQMIAMGTRRGTIPADVEISGSTVKAMLTGDLQYSSTQSTEASPGTSTTIDPNRSDSDTARPATQVGNAGAAPAKATAAPKPSANIRQGLIAAMNEEQQRLVKAGIYEKADIYEIQFAKGAEAIADATVTKPGKKTNKEATPMGKPPSQDPSQTDPNKQRMDISSRNWGVTAGMQLVQVLDLIIRNSNYITNQAKLLFNETTGQPEPNPRSNAKGIKWFNILAKTTPLAYDKKRNDFAYKIVYIIAPYTPTSFQSPYFPEPVFRGVHKRYPWWFTGQNSQVLDYQATFNSLYNITVSGNLPKVRQAFSSSAREIPFLQYQSRSTESSQGADTRANEVAANAAEYLYNPSDNGNAKVKILGDPAWIQQGSMTNAVDPKNLSFNPFNPDGGINFEVNDVMFEIVWQRPEDYDLTSGLADPYARTSKTFGNRDPIQSVVYRCKSVLSEFRQGRFEQTLDGTLYQYPVPKGTNKAPGASSAAASSNANADPYEIDDGGRPDEASSDALAARPVAATPTQVGAYDIEDTAGGGRGIVSGSPAADSGVVGDYIDSAGLETSGGPGARIAPSDPEAEIDQESGEFTDDEITPFDSAATASPDLPVTSNGQQVELSNEQQTFQSAPTPLPPATVRRSEAADPRVQEITRLETEAEDIEAEIRVRERRGQSTADQQTALARIRSQTATARGQQASVNNSQTMARET